MEFATLPKSDTIQGFNGIEVEEHRRERETYKAVQKLCDTMGQDPETETPENREA